MLLLRAFYGTCEGGPLIHLLIWNNHNGTLKCSSCLSSFWWSCDFFWTVSQSLFLSKPDLTAIVLSIVTNFGMFCLCSIRNLWTRAFHSWSHHHLNMSGCQVIQRFLIFGWVGNLDKFCNAWRMAIYLLLISWIKYDQQSQPEGWAGRCCCDGSDGTGSNNSVEVNAYI